MYRPGSRDTWCALNPDQRIIFKKRIADLYGLVCYTGYGFGCGNAFSSVEELTLDHIYPIARGGPVLDEKNMELLCRDCHDKKTRAEKLGH